MKVFSLEFYNNIMYMYSISKINIYYELKLKIYLNKIMFNLHFKNEKLEVNTSICMGRVLCTYFISYKTACNSPHKSTTDFFKCYPTRYVTIRLHAIARRHDDKTERHFMESINNIFFKIKFHTQKNLKSTKKREKYIKLRL